MYKKAVIFSILVIFLLLSCAQQELISDIPPKKEVEKYPTKSITHFMYGEIYRSSGNYNYANLEYKRALEYDTTATILNAIGESYLAIGKPSQASGFFEKALKLDPENETAGLNVLDFYMKNQRYEEAIPILETRIEKDPNIIEYQQWVAEAYRGVENYDKALIVLENMITVNESYPWPYIYAAEIKLEQNKIAEAAPYLEKVVRTVPPNDGLYEFWVRSLFESHNIEGMLSALEFWIQKEPQTLAPYFLYIDYQFRFNNNEKAISILDRIKDRWQESAQISYFQGLAAMSQNNADSVWFYFERADEFSDASADLYFHYGVWFWEQGKLASAEQICDRAIEKRGPGTQWLHMKAMINAQAGNLDVSEYLLQTSLSVDSLNINIMEDLANVYAELDKGDESVALYEKIIKLNPESPSIQNNYAFVLSQLNRDLDKAMKMVNKALKKEKSAAFCDTKAWILYRQKKYKQAENWIIKALDYDDVGADIYFHLGEIFKAMGDNEKAAQAYQQAIYMDANYQQALEALEELP